MLFYHSAADDGPIPAKDTGRRRGGPAKPTFARKDERPNRKKARGRDDERNRPPRRTTLRVGTGKKGRGAELNQRRGSLKKRDRSAEKEAKAEAAIRRKTISLPEGPISVQDLAAIMDEKPTAVIKFLMTDLGVMASMTQNLDPATCVAVVEGFGRFVGGAEDEDEEAEDEE